MNAPHIKCSVVMPGHIGTDIVANSRKVLSGSDKVDTAAARKMMTSMGMDTSALDDTQIGQMVEMQAIAFRDNAPTSAAQAAKTTSGRCQRGQMAHPRRQGRCNIWTNRSAPRRRRPTPRNSTTRSSQSTRWGI